MYGEKAIFAIVLLAVTFLVSGCVAEKEGGVLDVAFYDANGNLIQSTTFLPTMAIVNSIPDVDSIEVTSTITNTGNVALKPHIKLTASKIIIGGFLSNAAENFDCTTKLIIEPVSLTTSCVMKRLLTASETVKLSSGRISVAAIGSGAHEITASAFATYTDENGAQLSTGITTKSIILIIAEDPIKPGFTLDLGTSRITPPPPCIIACPSGMILSDEACVADPIMLDDGAIGCNDGVLNPILKRCEATPTTICPTYGS